MPIFRMTDDQGATYFDRADGRHIEARKASVEGFDSLPARVQSAWIETWAEEPSGEEVGGLDGLAAVTSFLKQNKKRTAVSTDARQVLILEVLSVSLAQATREEHSVDGVASKVDLLAAVRQILGVSYSTLASWASDVPDVEIVKELKKRAEASSRPGSSVP